MTMAERVEGEEKRGERREASATRRGVLGGARGDKCCGSTVQTARTTGQRSSSR